MAVTLLARYADKKRNLEIIMWMSFNKFLQDNYAGAFFLALIVGFLAGVAVSEQDFTEWQKWGNVADWVMIGVTAAVAIIAATIPQRLARQEKFEETRRIAQAVLQELNYMANQIIGQQLMIKKVGSSETFSITLKFVLNATVYKEYRRDLIQLGDDWNSVRQAYSGFRKLRQRLDGTDVSFIDDPTVAELLLMAELETILDAMANLSNSYQLSDWLGRTKAIRQAWARARNGRMLD